MADPARRRRIAEALAAAIAEQRPARDETLDVERLAAAIDTALGSPPTAQPLDPEGDGLQAYELNAANDI